VAIVDDDGTQTIVVTEAPTLVTIVLVKDLDQTDVETSENGILTMVYVVTTGLPLASTAVVVMTMEVVKLPVHVVRVCSGTKTATSVMVMSLPPASIEVYTRVVVMVEVPVHAYVFDAVTVVVVEETVVVVEETVFVVEETSVVADGTCNIV
jgi:hypothetical protein